MEVLIAEKMFLYIEDSPTRGKSYKTAPSLEQHDIFENVRRIASWAPKHEFIDMYFPIFFM